MSDQYYIVAHELRLCQEIADSCFGCWICFANAELIGDWRALPKVNINSELFVSSRVSSNA